MSIHHVAPDLLRISLAPGHLLNVYLAGDVLVDAGVSLNSGRLLEALEGHSVTAHALTHGHVDHQGASHVVCRKLGIPLLCGEGDRKAVETGDLTRLMPRPESFMARLSNRLGGPAHPVSGTLREGDEIGGFEVLETPGHTPGHLAFWRERDRVLILGDVLFHRHPVTLRTGLSEPVAFATWDRALNLASARRLAGLEPDLVCFGHGAPLRDGAEFRRYVKGLPEG
jgi:glyoxylase-like metal-dependent hydrolase (beta-lactamase superfamily II)